MELDGLAVCLARSRAGNAGPHDITWKKIERLIHLCPNCQFKSVNKLPAIKALNKFLKERRTQNLDRLYPPQDQLLDIKPETIYHFDELEQQAVLSLCKYLCVSRGQYMHKILPLLLRYLATLNVAKWPTHYFKNLFLMKYHENNPTSTQQQQQQQQTNISSEQQQESKQNDGNNIEEEEEFDETKDDEKNNDNDNNKQNGTATNKNNLNAIIEEPKQIDKARQSMIIDEDEMTHNKTDTMQTPTPQFKDGISITQDKSVTNLTNGTPIGHEDRARESDDDNKPDDQV